MATTARTELILCVPHTGCRIPRLWATQLLFQASSREWMGSGAVRTQTSAYRGILAYARREDLATGPFIAPGPIKVCFALTLGLLHACCPHYLLTRYQEQEEVIACMEAVQNSIHSDFKATSQCWPLTSFCLLTTCLVVGRKF